MAAARYFVALTTLAAALAHCVYNDAAAFPEEQRARSIIYLAGDRVPPSKYCIFHPPRVCVAAINQSRVLKHG